MQLQNNNKIDGYLDRIEARFLESKQRQRNISTRTKSDREVIDMGSAANMHLFEELYSSDNFSMRGKEIVDLITKYPPVVQTDFNLEKSIVDFITRRIGVKYDVGNVAVFRGAYGSYIPIFSSFAEKGLIIPENIHQIHKAHFAVNDFMLYEVPSDKQGLLDVQAIENTAKKTKGIKWVYINHNRGAAPSEHYLRSLTKLLNSYNLYALYDADVLFTRHVKNAKPWLPLITEDFFERSVLVSNLTKEFGVPGLRIGFGIGPEGLIDRVQRYQRINLEMTPPITKYLAKEIIDRDNVFKATQILTKRMGAVKSGFIRLGWPSFKGPEIGVNLFLKVPPGFQKAKKYNPDELFCYYLVQKAKVLLRPGSTYSSKTINEVRAVICQPLPVIKDFFTRLKNNEMNFGMKLPNGLEDDYARALLQIDDQKEINQSPARRYHSFVDFSNSKEILDFGIKKTSLVHAPQIAKWLGVKECLLKLETSHPTGTVKDRSTELTFSYLERRSINQYVHASTGNTATSLVWGLNQYNKPFSLTLIIPGKQITHHNFLKTKGLETILLEDATYDEARKYREWYVKEKKIHSLFSSFKNYRPRTYQIPYLEAFEEIRERGLHQPDFIFQTISGGSGIVGAHLAVKNAIKKGWLARMPKISIVQPDRADVISRCFNAGVKKYDSRYTQKILQPSKTFAIRRGDASGCYEKVKQVLDETKGIAVSTSEKEIAAAKNTLRKLEGIEAGYTACTALAGIRKEVKKNKELKRSTVLVILTGIDRSTKIQPKIDKVVTKKEWRRVVTG